MVVVQQNSTHSPRQLASIAPPDGGARTLATSWVGYKDLYELTWASHLIVRGTVTADCGTGESPQSGLESPKEMLVTIDAVYRGLPRTSVLVPRTSDGFSNDPRLSFEVGDDVILFLSEPEDGGAWPVGGPQGHWRVVEDHAVPFEGMFPELPIEAFPEAIATALRQDPPVAGNALSLAQRRTNGSRIARRRYAATRMRRKSPSRQRIH